MNRKSVPRADSLCHIRDITYICDEKKRNTLDYLLAEINRNELIHLTFVDK